MKQTLHLLDVHIQSQKCANQPPNSVWQTPASEADSCSASHDIPHFTEPQGSLLCSPTTCLFPEPDQYNQRPLLFNYIF